MSYVEDVGGRLRAIRLSRGLSLQEVERKSGGEWKAAVVGSYERGDRNISASRLCELAEFYGVAPVEILPVDDVPPVPAPQGGLRIDLERLAREEGPRWRGVRRYLESIQAQRGDFNRSVLTVRTEDLRALAVIADAPTDRLVGELRGAELTVD